MKLSYILICSTHLLSGGDYEPKKSILMALRLFQSVDQRSKVRYSLTRKKLVIKSDMVLRIGTAPACNRSMVSHGVGLSHAFTTGVGVATIACEWV